MKNNEQNGFILMIVVMIALAVFIIGFATYRITQANKTDTEAFNQSISVVHITQ